MRKPRFFYGWVIVALSFLTMGLAGGIQYSFSVFFVALLQEFGGNRAGTALAFSLYVVTHGLVNPIVGMLVERYGVRRLIPLGAIFLALALAACSLVNTLWQYYLVFGVLVSLGSSAVGAVPSYVVLNQWFVKRRGLALGTASAGIGAIGIFLIVPFCQYLVTTAGWRGGYLGLAIITLVLLPASTHFLERDRPQDIGLLPDGATSRPAMPVADHLSPTSGADSVQRGQATTQGLRGVLQTRRFWMLCLVFFLTPFATQPIFVHEVAYFLDLGHSQFVAAGVAALVGLASTPMKIGVGWLSDRLGRLVVYTGGVGCTVFASVTLLIMPYASGEWTLYLFAVVFATGYATQATLNPALAADSFSGRDFPVIYGLLSGTQAAGAALGAWLAGFLFDAGGSYAPAFVTGMTAVSLACAILWLASPRQASVGRTLA